MSREAQTRSTAGQTPSIGSGEMRGRSVVRVRVHIALVALLAAVICGTAGSMLLVQIEGSRRIVRDSAFTYMDAVGLRVVDRTAALVDPIIRVLRVLATRPALLETTTPANGEILPGFLAALRQDPDLYAMHVSYADGNFFWVESLMAVPPARRATLAAPENADYRLTEIQLEGEHRVQRRWRRPTRRNRYPDRSTLRPAKPAMVPRSACPGRTKHL